MQVCNKGEYWKLKQRFLVELDQCIFFVTDNMGLVCSRSRRFREADAEENAQVFCPL